jgi:hypothetical protein
MTSPEPDMAPEELVSPSGDRLDLAKALDEISLEQALIDVEIANARAMDLTSRLLSARRDLVSAQEQAKFYRDCVVALEAELDAIRSSRTYAVARRVIDLKKFVQ